MQRVTIDHTFTSPPDRVYAYLAEHENLGPLFGAKVKRLKDGDDGTRNGVGSRRQLQVVPLPPFEETVVEAVPQELIRYRITKGGILRDHEGRMRFSPGPAGGTRLHYEIEFGAVLPGLDRLVKLSLQRSIARALPAVDRQT